MADSAEGTGSDGSPESAGSRGSTASGESGRPAVRVLLDTNVVLDWLLDGAPWANAAQPLWDARDAGRVVGHLPASVLTDIFYIARRQIGIPGANAAVDLYLDAFDVLPLDKSLLQQARTLPGSDFEDNVQIVCARAASLDLIVTRDPSGFVGAGLPAIDPRDIARYLAQP